jgi:hypothetical protein
MLLENREKSFNSIARSKALDASRSAEHLAVRIMLIEVNSRPDWRADEESAGSSRQVKNLIQEVDPSLARTAWTNQASASTTR